MNETDYTKGSEFALWSKYEDVAMHFNDLIMRLRTQALGGLTGVVAISGVAMNVTGKPASGSEWEIMAGAIGFFTFAWIALGVLDLCYYDRLLGGAVEAIIDHEKRTMMAPDGITPRNDAIVLSTRIRSNFSNSGGGHRKWVVAFYVTVLVALIFALVYSIVKAVSPAATPTSQNIESKITRGPGDKMQLSIEPASTVPTKGP